MGIVTLGLTGTVTLALAIAMRGRNQNGNRRASARQDRERRATAERPLQLGPLRRAVCGWRAKGERSDKHRSEPAPRLGVSCPERCKSVAVESAATVHAPHPRPWLEPDPFRTPRVGLTASLSLRQDPGFREADRDGLGVDRSIALAFPCADTFLRRQPIGHHLTIAGTNQAVFGCGDK